jgi:hypothetical protein
VFPSGMVENLALQARVAQILMGAPLNHRLHLDMLFPFSYIQHIIKRFLIVFLFGLNSRRKTSLQLESYPSLYQLGSNPLPRGVLLIERLGVLKD